MTKIVFMGTPDFALPTLSALLSTYEVIGVVTQPDRPAGRKGELTPPPVKVLAQQHGIPVLQPPKLRHPDAIAQLSQWQADVFVVAAFGQILPQRVLDMPRMGCLNVHGSLLPRWRGAAPIQAAIQHGDSKTGITIMQMDAGLDTGPILTQRALAIHPDDTGQTLHDRMAQLGAELLLDTLPDYLAGKLTPTPQDDALATFAPQISKQDGHVDWSKSAAWIERTVRAFSPWPTAYSFWEGKQLKWHKAHAAVGSAPLGQVIRGADGVVAIGTGDGLFCPQIVQLEGKKAVTIAEFLNGYPQFVGAKLA